MSLRDDLRKFEDLGLSEGIPARIYEAQIELIAKAADLSKRSLRRKELTARRLGLQKRIEELQAIPADATKNAWCADYTEDLTGEVGTIEIPGEGQDAVIIHPGFEEAAAHTPARDGVLHFRKSQSPGQLYYNAAILPGWQKWMPTFRVGEITAIDYEADTAGVTLDSETSSAQSLGIDPQDTLTLQGVPVEYMECNAAVFEVGDRVVVQFREQSPADPVVIGFESEPKPCDIIVGHPIVVRFEANGQIGVEPLCHPALSEQVREGWHTINTEAYRLWIRDGVRAVVMRNFEQFDTAEFTLDVDWDYINNSAIGQVTHTVADWIETPSITIDVLQKINIPEDPVDPADCLDPAKLITRTYHLAGHDNVNGNSPYDNVIVHKARNALLDFTLTDPINGPIALTWEFAQAVDYGIYSIYPDERGTAFFVASYETDLDNPYTQVNISLVTTDFPDIIFSPTGLEADQKTYEPIEIIKHLSGGVRGVTELFAVRHRVKPPPPV